MYDVFIQATASGLTITAIALIFKWLKGRNSYTEEDADRDYPEEK